MIDSATSGLQNKLYLKERCNALEFFLLNLFLIHDSAFSALRNELDLKERSITLELFLLKSFVIRLVQFNVFCSHKRAGLMMRFMT